MSLRRKAVDPAQRTQMRHKPFIAPTGGWVSAANLAAAPANTAQVCENWLPTTTGLRMRGGNRKHATASSTEPLESAMAYAGGATRKMFGAAGGSIFELTSVVDEDTPPVADVTGQTSDYYAHVNVATVGGNYMYAVNGTDKPRLYDGSAWTAIDGVSTPAITGVTTTLLSHVNVYRNRLWFVKDGSMDAVYLPVDSLGGAIGTVSLSGVFRRGGALLFTATWSMDAGDGLDDKIVFVSTEGEYIVYQGDPGTSASWSIVGVYDGSPPLGKNAFLRVGGDLLILTEVGLIPMSAIQAKDPAALGLAAVSRNIEPDWVYDARQRRNLPWEIVKWSNRNLAIVSCPVTAEESITPPWCYAVNLETGAWTKITGWNTRCLVLHNDQVYFGTNAGTLQVADTGGTDDGELIYYTYIGQNDHLGSVGQLKTIRQARAIFRTKNEFTPQISVSTDYVISLPTPPDAAASSGASGVWDVGVWDEARWDTGSNYYTVTTRWISIGTTGFVHAPQVQVTSGSVAAPSAELITFEVTYEPGGTVV